MLLLAASIPVAGAAPNEKEADLNPAVAFSVLDEATGKPIPSFRIVAGVPVGGGINNDYTKRTGNEVVNWQPHMTKLGEGGTHVWSLERAWDQTGFRLEADGYIPQQFTWIVKKEGSRKLEFKLQRDPGIVGKVLLPDGKPAGAALIGLSLIQRQVAIKGASFYHVGEALPEKPGDRWRRASIFETRRNGEFKMTTETDPAAVIVAVHPQGTCDIPYVEFLKTKTLPLKRWGRVEGSVTVGDGPGAGRKVTLSIQRDQYGYPGLVSQSLETKTDAEGKFAFEDVAPGKAQVSLPEFFPKIEPNRRPGFHVPIPAGAYAHVEVLSGETVTVKLGGESLGEPTAPLELKPIQP
jgi:hypothetical protein